MKNLNVNSNCASLAPLGTYCRFALQFSWLNSLIAERYIVKKREAWNDHRPHDPRSTMKYSWYLYELTPVSKSPKFITCFGVGCFKERFKACQIHTCETSLRFCPASNAGLREIVDQPTILHRCTEIVWHFSMLERYCAFPLYAWTWHRFFCSSLSYVSDLHQCKAAIDNNIRHNTACNHEMLYWLTERLMRKIGTSWVQKNTKNEDTLAHEPGLMTIS